MNKKILRYFVLLFAVVLLITSSGCGPQTAEITWYDFNAEYKTFGDCVVAENSKYALMWNKEYANVTLYDKVNDISYSNVPENAAEKTSHPDVMSPITVGYIDPETLNTSKTSAYRASVKIGAFSSEKIDNGVKVTYYFEEIAVSVPVKYILREDSLLVEIDPDEIGEDLQLVYSISVLPFFCSVSNDSDNQSYLFVPSGSGALIYPKTLGGGVASIIKTQLYGQDLQIDSYDSTYIPNMYLPVYGAKNGNSAVCAVIESGDETAEIVSDVGSSTYAYSAVYPEFYIRGSEISTSTYLGNYTSSKTLFCNGKVKNKISIGFYPLQGDNANYMGMAETYRNYLINEKGLKEKNNDRLLNIKFIGGAQTRKFALGVPYTTLNVLTKFEDVYSISNELYSDYKEKMNIKLVGFGETGIDIGKIAGGISYNKSFGNIETVAELQSNKDLSVFLNFDMIRFSEDGKGVSSLSGVARSSIGMKNKKLSTKLAYLEPDSSSNGYYLLRRSMFNDIAEEIEKKCLKWDIGGVSLDTLTSMSYSDYNDQAYYAKSNFSSQTISVIEQFHKSGMEVAASGANAYAAVNSDVVYDAPTRSAKYQVYDRDVPFYHLVFKGYTPLAVKSLNLTENYHTSLLQAIEVGAGLNYTLIASHNTDLITAENNLYYSSVYADTKKQIKEDIQIYNEAFQKTANAIIEDHSILENGLHCTVFNNGVTVYVNYTDDDLQIDDVIIPSNDFALKEEVAQ